MPTTPSPQGAVLDPSKFPSPTAFADFLTILHAARYTGPLTFHFQHGVPYVVEILPAPPVKLRLTHAPAPTGA